MSEAKWYVVHTYSGYENKVKANIDKTIETRHLEDQILEVRVPLEEVPEIRNGVEKVVQRKMFPGYVMIHMIMNDDTWYVVRNTPGVIGFVGSGGKPLPLEEEEVQQMLKRVGLEEAKAALNFSVGDTIRVVGGPFNEMIGIVEAINEEKEKAKVRLSMFGREMPVELDFVNIEVI